MRKYADPNHCPDCGQPIFPNADTCAACALPLRGQRAQDLYVTLMRADQLLGELRASAGSTTAVVTPVIAPRPTVQPMSPAPPAPGVPLLPVPAMRTASVPKILLGLGAACLLVAAIVFLAVAWSVMGVGGRTATLLGFTVVAGRLASWVARRDLRGAAEALGAVTLGLVCLDVLGAAHAGWFGDVSAATTTILVGTVLAVLASGTAILARRVPIGAFVAGELGGALGVAFVVAGVMGLDADGAVKALTATLIAAAATFAAHRLRLEVTVVCSAVVTGLAWLLLALAGWVRVDPSEVSPAWDNLDAWPLLAAAATAGALAALRVPQWIRVLGAAGALTALACAVTAPSFDASSTVVTLNGLAVGLVAAALLGYLPRRWAASATPLAFLGGVAGVGALCHVGGQAVDAVSDARARDIGVGSFDRIAETGWLIPAAMLTLAVLAAGGLRAFAVPVREGVPARGACAGLAAAGVLLVPAYGGPVWLWVLLLLVLVVAALALDWLPEAAAAAAVALFSASADDRMLALTLIVALLACAAVMVRHRQRILGDLAGAIAQPLLGWLVLVAGALSGASATWAAAVGIVLVLGLPLAVHLAVARPSRRLGDTLGLELGGAMTAIALFTIGSEEPERPWTWVAVYLTLAGVVLGITALLRPDRRGLGRVGGLLFAAATWVRLADLGVTAPEPYTLPSAAVLLAVGWLRLRRDPSASTFVTLSPGLSLALAPSLLWVLADPITPRALLLGLACLALVLVGAQAKLAAPLMLGALAGALVLLVEIAPYGQAVPRWAVIGTAGVLLVALGVTWEARVRQARAIGAYVGGLR
ncbi:MAG: hypothetical protein QM655_04855 [Nocardioidaceae bacterium]